MMPDAVEVARFTVGPVQTNAYLLTRGGAAVLVDPGAEPERLLHALERSGATLRAVWLTHADVDHVGALAAVLRARPVPVHLHPADLPLLRHAAEQAAAWGWRIEPPPTATRDLPDDTRVLPGHGAESTVLGERRNNPFLVPG